MKKLFLLLFLIPNLVLGGDVYKYIGLDNNENIVGEGEIIFTAIDTKLININVNIIGKIHSYIFKTKFKKVEGFNIWDIKDLNARTGISIFTLQIDPKLEFNTKSTYSNVETLDRNHHELKDQMWNFKVTFSGLEELKLGKDFKFEAIHLSTRGERPTGPGHCMMGSLGVLGVESWYDKFTGKLLKQIFVKRHCRPNENKILSKELIELQPMKGQEK